MARSVKYLTLGFSSGHDLMVLRSSPALSWQCEAYLGFFLSPLSAPPPTCALSRNKHLKFLKNLAIGVLQQERETGFKPKYNKDKWGFIAKEQGECQKMENY